MDKLDMNVFNKIKEKKHTEKIKEVEKPDRNFKQLNKEDIEKIENDISNLQFGGSSSHTDKDFTNSSVKKMISKTGTSSRSYKDNSLEKTNSNLNSQITPKIINSNKTSSELQLEMKNNNLLVRNNQTGITSITGQYRGNKNELVTANYKVKTVSGNMPTVNWDNFQNVAHTGMTSKEKDFFVNTVTNNKLSFGTTQMMNNEILHAHEAIESGIYISWESKDVSFKTTF